MKNRLVLICIVLALVCCGPKKDAVERGTEDGIEVVINHLEPYRTGDPGSFRLERIFAVDTEEDSISNIGLVDILGFAVNTEGEIFALRSAVGEGDFIFKFDKNGEFIKSFGPRGQGPGEFQNPKHIALDSEDNIVILDFGGKPLRKYDGGGNYLGGFEMSGGDMTVKSGPGGNLLVLESSMDPETRKFLFALNLLGPELEILKEDVDSFGFAMMEQGKFKPLEPVFCWGASATHIFAASEDRGYEIRVYDSGGNPVRKIRKAYEKVPVSEDSKEKALKPLPENMRAMASFPEFHPSLRSISVGDDGTVLAATFEEGENPGEVMCDIFSRDGVFTGRISLDAWIWESHMWTEMKGETFYCLREKPSGYKELVVSKILCE
jgi:hypothetical protein